MVQECTFLFPDGRRCRRIPKRGEKLCHGHKRRRRLPAEMDALFLQQMDAWVEHLNDLPLQTLLSTLQESLADIQELIERKSSRRHRLLFHRAVVAVTCAIDHVDAAMASYREEAARRAARRPAAARIPSSEEVNAQLNAIQSMSPEQLDAWCHRLVSTVQSRR